MACERSVDVAAASGTLHVALLGGFSVRAGSRAVPGSWRLRKSKTLVKLLAFAGGHRAHRDVIAGVLWPGLGPAAAANNLHQALHAARRDRFYAFIQYEREAAGLPAPTLEGVAKLALLAVRYPHLLSALGEDVEQDGADRCLLSVPETAQKRSRLGGEGAVCAGPRALGDGNRRPAEPCPAPAGGGNGRRWVPPAAGPPGATARGRPSRSGRGLASTGAAAPRGRTRPGARGSRSSGRRTGRSRRPEPGR